MQLYDVIWKERYIQKLEDKHGVSVEEVEQALFSSPFIRRIEKGKIKGEDLYAAYGKTEFGRYLITFFIYKKTSAALPISARDMTQSEKRYYERQK